MSINQKTNCANCKELLHGEFCHRCGQKNRNKRWTIGLLIEQFIRQITNFEKGMLRTVKSLFTEPGQLITDYWKGKTVNYYNPFRYVLIWVAINVLVSFWIGLDDLIQQSVQTQIIPKQDAGTMEVADKTFDSWLNFLVLLMLPVFSFLTYKFFPKKKKNYAEHFIMNSFMMGQQSLITSFTNLIFPIIPFHMAFFMIFNFLIGLAYNTYVFKQVFEEKWWKVIGKALILGLMGLLVFGVIIEIASRIALAIS